MPAKPKLGQNFLVDARAQRAIADALGDLQAATVVEIGPGKGAITDILAARAAKLVAIELDDRFAPALRTRFALLNDAAGAERVEVLHADVLGVDMTALAERLGTGSLLVVGNLPYYITSDILLHLCAHVGAIRRAVLMVQREVADRIVASPGTRDFGMLSATCQMYARCERLFTLPPEAFAPPPEVHSSVVRLTMAPRFEELGVEPTEFLKYLRCSFAQKRKTLANNLRAAGYAAGAVSAALEAAGVDGKVRAETLSLEAHASVFGELIESSR